jgi:aminoglycoside 6'-N-acetyltransferase
LEAPHVKAWWDQEISYDLDLISKKYGRYVKGYKGGVDKPISAYIIEADRQPVGYIQIYNAYDFPRAKPLLDLPTSLGALDFFIGEADCLGKGIGAKVLKEFLADFTGFTHVLVDPYVKNISAIKTYEKAGFKKIKTHYDVEEVWMMFRK